MRAVGLSLGPRKHVAQDVYPMFWRSRKMSGGKWHPSQKPKDSVAIREGKVWGGAKSASARHIQKWGEIEPGRTEWNLAASWRVGEAQVRAEGVVGTLGGRVSQRKCHKESWGPVTVRILCLEKRGTWGRVTWLDMMLSMMARSQWSRHWRPVKHER